MGGQNNDDFLLHIDPEWLAFRELSYGYLRLNIPSRDKIQVDFVRNADNQIADSTTMYNNPDRYKHSDRITAGYSGT
jgi:hypothetical protein